MALATKFRIEGTSDIYGKVTVNIKLDSYAGSIIELDAVGRNWIELKIGDNSNDISNPILSGKLSVQFYVSTDFQTTEIGRSEYQTYYVEVLDGVGDQIWAGWALPEEYREAYHNTPYVATLVASDGLEELKNVNFTLQDGKATLFSHLQACLINTFVDNDIFESINIYSNGMATTSADSPLKQAQVTYNSFRSISETPKAYEVLSAILVPFFARVYQYRGWRIENILEKRSSYIVRQYDITSTYIGQTTFDPLVKFDTDYADFRAFIQKSGSLSIRPALNNAEVYFNTVEPVEPTTSQGFQNADDWVSTTELDKWTAVGSNITIEQVTSSYQNNEFAVKIPGRKTTLEQTDYLESDAININSADYETINIEFAHYANYPAVVLLGTKPILYFEIVFTETATGDVYNWTGSEWVLIPLGQARKRLRIDFNDRMKWRTYTASVDRVPSNGNIKFRFYKLIKSGTEGVTELRLTAWKTNLITEQSTNAALLLEGATTNVFTQYKGPSFPHIISDGTVLNAAGVMDVANTLTATWARRGVTESLNIRRLFLLQWLTFNSKPTELLTGTIHQKGEVITPMTVIKDKDAVSSVRYVMTSYSFSLGSGIGSGSYRELVTVDANINAFQEFLDTIRLGDFFPQTINYNIFVGGAPGLSPNANPGQIDLNFSLNGDVRGGLNQAELTPAAIQNKARLDITGLTGNDIVIGAVKDDPSQENMTNLRLSDTYPIIDNNFVPYTGAKNNVDLGEKGIRSGYYRFDTTPTSTPTDQGTMFWDEDDLTVDIILNGYRMKIGEDQFYPVKNQTGSNIAKGTVVRFAGTVGASGRLLIAPFLADGSLPSTRFMGVTAEDINNGEDGKVLWFGRLRGIDTSAFAEGDILYASTTVAGAFQTTIPVAPNNVVEIAAVVTDATNGTIFIRPQINNHNPVTLGTANGLSLSNQVLSLGLASAGVTGALSGTDWTTFNGKIGGSIASGQVAFGTGVNTVGGDNGFTWDNTNKRIGVGTNTPRSTFDFIGLGIIQGTTLSDSGQLGSELLTTGTSDASWTGSSFATGYTHIVGSTTTLTSTLAGIINTFYQITYTVTGRTTGSFTIAFGGQSFAGLTASGAVGPQATTTGTLVITPTSDFNGTIVLSIRVISISSASVVFNSSAGTVTNQLRISNLITNTFFGLNSGQRNTTGAQNTFLGSSAGFNNTSGGLNSFFGFSSGLSNITGSENSFFGRASGSGNLTGSNNSFFGNSSGESNTSGSLNSFFGFQAGFANTTGNNNTYFGLAAGRNQTTGSNNVALGRDAGRILASGAVLSIANNSIFIGFNTRANADSETNQIVIGHTAIGLGSNTIVLGNSSHTLTRLFGSVGIGVDAPTNTLDVNGTTRIRTISNLGSTATRFLVASATGVISERTGAEMRTDLAVQSSIIGSDTHVLYFDGANNPSGDSGLKYLKTTKRLEITDASTALLGDLVIDKNSANNQFTIISARNRNNTGETSFAIRNNIGYGAFTIYGSLWADTFLRNKAFFTTESTVDALGFNTLGSKPIEFYTNNTYRASFLGNGNFLIGTSTDSGQMVQVNGQIKTNSISVFNNNSVISSYQSGSSANDAIKISNTSGGATLGIQNNNSSGFSGIEYLNQSGNLAVFSGFNNSNGQEFRFNNVATNGWINFRIAGTERITIYNSGNIGLSTTADPSARLGIRGTGTTTGVTLLLEDSGGTDNVQFLDNGRVQFQRLPTSSAGLGANDLWNDGGNVVIGTTQTFRDESTAKTTASADQTLPSGVLTILDYDTTLINNNTSIYTVGTTGRITVNSTGIYTITAGVVIEADAVTALESAFLGIFRNGDLVAISSINTTIAAGAQSGLSTSTILSLTSGDIIDCRALVNSVGGVANGLARRLGTLLGANATQVNSLSISKSSQ